MSKMRQLWSDIAKKVQGEAARLATVPPPAAPISIKAPQPGTGGAAHDDSIIRFTPNAALLVLGVPRMAAFSGAMGIVDIDAGQSGLLTLSVKIEAEEDNVVDNDFFTQEVSVTWKVSADASGALTITTPMEKIGGPHQPKEQEAKRFREGKGLGGGLTSYTLDSLNPEQGKSYVQVTPVIVGTTDSTELSGEIEGLGGSKTSQKQASKVKQAIRVEIKVNVSEAPEPKVEVEFGDEVTVGGKFDYEIGPFKVGSADELEVGSITAAVHDMLYEKFPPEGREALVNEKSAGGELIEVHGYTSNTDSQAKNLPLSTKRAHAVIQAFKKLGIPENLFTKPKSHGEWESHPTDDKREETEDAEWRKVVLKVRQEITVKRDPQTGKYYRVK